MVDEGRRRFRRAAVVSLLCLVAAVVVAPPVKAGTTGAIELVSQSTWVAPDGAFDIEVAAVGPAGATIELAVYPQVSSRFTYRNSITSGPVGLPVLTSTTVTDGSGVVALAVPLSVGPEAGRLVLDQPGVYPVELSLLDIDGTRLDSFVTHLVRVPEVLPRNQFPLAVALTVSLDTSVSLSTDGRRDLSDADQGIVNAFTDSLRAQPDVPATVSVSPETLASLDGRGRSDLRDAVKDRLLLARPYVDLDPTAWLEAGLDSEFINALGVGLTTTDAVLDQVPDTSLWLAEPTLTADNLATLGGLGYERFVFRPEHLELLNAARFPFTLSQQFLVEDSNGQRYPAAAIDPAFVDLFPRGVEPELAAHQLLAELAIVASDQPRTPRGVVVSPPADWTPDSSFLRIVLGGLGNHPLLEPVALDQWFDTVSEARELGQRSRDGFILDRDLVPAPAADLSFFSTRYTTAAADLFSFGSVVGDGASALAQLNDFLLVAGSNDLSAAEASAYLTAIETTVADTTGSISFDLPDRVTFAAREGDVPLVIENTLDAPMSILISLSSDKLEFPDGTDQLVNLAPGLNDVSVAVSARTSGDSVLGLAFSSPDRAIDLGTRRVIVRSTALSGVALIIAALALLFLLVWWLRARRARDPNERLLVAASDPASNVPTPERV